MAFRRALTGVGCAVALGCMAVGPAAAAPLEPSPTQQLVARCAGAQVTLASVPGQGVFAPYLVVDTGQVLIPQLVHFGGFSVELKTRHRMGNTAVKPSSGSAGGADATWVTCFVDTKNSDVVRIDGWLMR